MQTRSDSQSNKLALIEEYLIHINAINSSALTSFAQKLKHYLIQAQWQINHGQSINIKTLSLKSCLAPNDLTDNEWNLLEKIILFLNPKTLDLSDNRLGRLSDYACESLCTLLTNLSINSLNLSKNEIMANPEHNAKNVLLAILLVLQNKPSITTLDLTENFATALLPVQLASTFAKFALTHITQLHITESELSTTIKNVIDQAFADKAKLHALYNQRSSSLANITARFYRQHVQHTTADNIAAHPLNRECIALIDCDEQMEEEIQTLVSRYGNN